ncbi:unnamed protein product [Trichobilharzia szidati]|nr:unnamed protein product [Trichobilharzia szidati]
MNKTHLNHISQPSTSMTDNDSLNMTTKVRFVSNLLDGHLCSDALTPPSMSKLTSLSTGDHSISPDTSTCLDLKNFSIGDRVYLNKAKQRGTIAYIGPTHFAAEDLVGIVLDSNCGKHDGSINGIRYFQCAAKRGVFCPINELSPLDNKRTLGNSRPRHYCESEHSRNYNVYIADKRKSNSLSLKNCRGQFDRNNRNYHSFRSPSTLRSDNFSTQQTGRLQRSWSERCKFSGKSWKDSLSTTDDRIFEPYGSPRAVNRIHRSNTLPGNAYKASQDPSISTSRFVRGGSLPRLKEDNCVKKAYPFSEISSTSASKLYDKRHRNFPGRNAKLDKLRNSSNSYTDINQSLINPPFRNSLRLIKLNRLNRCSSGQMTKTDDQNNPAGFSYYPSEADKTCSDNELFLVNSVISCAQERLSELQNEVLQYHAYNVKLLEQLTHIKSCQNEISHKLEEKRRNDVLQSQHAYQRQRGRIKDIKSKLLQEYARSRNLVIQFHNLKVAVKYTSPRELINTIENNCYSQDNNSIGCINISNNENDLNKYNNNIVLTTTFHPIEGVGNIVHSRKITCNTVTPESLVSSSVNTGQEIMQLRKQKLIIYDAYQCHYQNIIKRLIAYQRTLTEQVYDVSLCNHSENRENTSNSYKTTCTEHQVMLNMAKERNCKLSMELSVLNAEILHLSSRPERQLYDFLKQLDSCKSTNDRLHQTIQDLEEQITKIQKDLEDAKKKLNKEDVIHLTLMRMNLRIHQLKQMEIRARSLQNDQCMSIQTKEKELTEAMNKMDLLSQAWANERQAKITSVQKLRENLKSLSGEPPKIYITHKINHVIYDGGARNNGIQTSDTETPILPNSLFSALCKEIRRLQSRSVSLVEALDLLSAGNYNAEKLDHIKSLVLTSNASKKINNTAISSKTNSYNSYDTKLHNSVRSVKLRNNSKASGNSCSIKRYSDILPTLIQNKQISVIDNRAHRITSFRNSDHDQKSKHAAIQEPTKGKISVPSSVDDLRLETRVSSLQQQQQQQHKQNNNNQIT